MEDNMDTSIVDELERAYEAWSRAQLEFAKLFAEAAHNAKIRTPETAQRLHALRDREIECARKYDGLAEQLREMGFDVQRRPTVQEIADRITASLERRTS
jgi:hypothetical protein